MPSPIGHALGGIAAGSLISPRPDRRTIALFATAGILADIDLLLPMVHRGPAHSLTAAALAFAAALIVLTWKTRSATSVRLAAAIGAAYLTHILLDWLGEDGGPPRGIMALWPFSSSFYVSGLDLFHRVERRYWRHDFWQDNAAALLTEVAILAPAAWLALRGVRMRRG